MLASIRKPILTTRQLLARLKNILPFLPDCVRLQLNGHGEIRHIFTHMTLDEKLALYKFARRQAEGSIFVEIGSYLGASSCFLAAAAADIRGTEVHCVDTWQNEGMTEGFRDTWDEFKKNTSKYRNIIFPHRGLSANVARIFEKKVDLLFIDGDHSYEACRQDVENWLPRLKSGGLLIMHDYGWAEGVKKVVREVVSTEAVKEGRLSNLYWMWKR